MAMLLLAVYLYHELSLSEEPQSKHFFEVMQQISVVQSLKSFRIIIIIILTAMIVVPHSFLKY